ncbi:Spy0128 family protein [Butyrivibrio sp. XPD2006]|uniref:Spy0128 family protein n=1 Tax=Butyrivibrio sp. XPD2006 TaxID=1280668 RepID=UPI0003B31F71|nr:Cna B-type domain-containing protein [Butyrivibrio sp. XPD2006]
MRKVDENRARNYITKHERYKKWLVFALCISLLTGTATLYMLNKPATAMTEDALETVGVVVPTADAEFEQELIELTQENKLQQTSAGENNSEASLEGSSGDESVDGDETGAEGDDAANLNGEDPDASDIEDENGESKEENNASVDELTDEEKAELEAKEKAELEAKEKAELEEKEKAEKEAKEAEEKLKNAEAVELSEDIVLTVSYIDENGDALADEKEISLTDSIDFSSEAREIEGYVFKEATIDGAVITVITAKQDADEHKYYEVTLASGDVVEIKENKTVVLTYTSENVEEEEVVAAESVKLTARYIDSNGEEIQEAAELNITKELEFNEDFEELIDGYFYEGVFYEESEIARITPVVAEQETEAETADGDAEEATESSDESEEAAETSEVPEVIVTGYDITTKSGDVISVTEDTEITFKYLKACEETEFAFEDSKITVKIATTRSGVFPEGIQLKVAEVTPESSNYNYDAYLDALNENADAIANESGKDGAETFSENNTLMYDIAFIYEDKEIQPKEGSVIVTMEFKDQQLSDGLAAESNEDLAVVHLPIKEEVKEATEIATTEEATDITSEDIKVETLTDASAEVGDEQKVEFTSDTFSVFAVIAYQKHDPGTDTFKSVLGDAVNFGITSYQISVNESETNFASKIVYADSQTGNDMTNPAEQTFIAASILGNFRLKGEDAYFMVPSQYRSNVSHEKGADHIKLDTTYTEAELGGVVDDMMAYVRNASADLATRKQTAFFQSTTAGSLFNIIDTTSYAAGTYYVTVDDSNLYKITGQNGGLTIMKNSDQTIVFNVVASGSVGLQKYIVVNDGVEAGSDTLEGTHEDKVARTIIWNFPYATDVYSAGSVAGVMISGQQNATWTNKEPSSGWVVFPNVVIGGEFHNTYDEVQQISGTAQFQAYKNVDGKPSKVSGFKFTLYRWDFDANKWIAVETVKNTEESPEYVIFGSIGYGNEADKKNRPNYQYTTLGVGETDTFYYAIQETDGSTDSEGKAYSPDTTIFYASVDVTCQKLNEYTDTTFYRVSAPTYYTDPSYSQKVTGIPTFKNTTKRGSVGISLYKYLNDGDPGNQKFSFTVRKIQSDGSMKTITSELTNDGKDINFSVDYTSADLYRYLNSTGYSEGKLCLIITENDVTNASGSDVKKDKGYIFVRVDNPGTSNQKINYYKVTQEQIAQDVNISRIESKESQYSDKGTYFKAIATGTKYWIDPTQYAEKLAFFNTGGGQLRIHKMVVNAFGSDFVRNNTKTAMLANIYFRVTNLDTGTYLVIKGFVDIRNGRDRTFYDSTGKSYKVTYNNNAQWTISGLPAGRYQVEEVADGLTLGYDANSNSSYVIESTPLSRVTKYDVTTDSNTGADNYGTGGQNLRKVYSKDLSNHYDTAPEAHVGGEVQTVQVCNYYSIPVGPIEISKNFIGGTWGTDKSFTFQIEADTEKGYRAWDSSNSTVNLASQPMPEKTQVTITGDGVNNTQVASFGAVPFRYEGDYNYKITEVEGNTPGVKYDKTVYYVEIQVRKKYTQFKKEYTGENMSNPENYDTNVDLYNETEDFFYLGADIYYRDSEGNTLAVCKLTLPENLKTFMNADYNFDMTWSNTNGVHDVAFNNTLTGSLTVSKEWIDMSGNVNNNGHSALPLDIWQRSAGSSEWKLYTGTTVVLSSDNDWKQTVTGLPLYDDAGNAYEYCVKESDSYLATYAVVYKYNGQEYFAEGQNKIKVGGVETKDTGYHMTFNEQTASYGDVVVSNRNVVTNVIPSTGGVGTTCYVAIGALLIAIAFAGMMLFRKRKSF